MIDRPEVRHRRQRLKELIDLRFGGEQKNLLTHIQDFADVSHNQGEMSGLVSGTKAFGEKKAARLCELIGLRSGWFDLPLGSGFDYGLPAGQPGLEAREPRQHGYKVASRAGDEEILVQAFRLAHREVQRAWLSQARSILNDHHVVL